MNSIKCPRCGLVSFATAPECKRCHAEFPALQEIVAPDIEQPAPTNQPAAFTPLPASFEPLPEYEVAATPIGGWLIVFALGMGVSLALAVFWIQTFLALSSTKLFHDLTTPGSSLYISSFSSGVTFEMIWIVTVTITTVILLLRFFRKSSSFPRLAITILAANIAFAFIDYLLGLNVQREMTEKLAHVYGRGKLPDLSGYMGLIVLYCIVSSTLWIGYFLTSRRVESTFIN